MFRLTRYFSIASLLGIMAVVVALSYVYRDIAVETLKDNETRAHASLTRAFSNSLGAEYRDFIREMALADADVIMADPRFTALDEQIRTMMNGLRVIKVKIYAPSGNTVYSTQRYQIGKDKSGSMGLMLASDGEIAGEITFRDPFYSLEGAIADRNIVSTYVPLQAGSAPAVQGVFELYSDVTPLLARINDTQVYIVSIVLAILFALYVFLFFIVRRAESIMHKNEADRRRNEAQVRYPGLSR